MQNVMLSLTESETEMRQQAFYKRNMIHIVRLKPTSDWNSRCKSVDTVGDESAVWQKEPKNITEREVKWKVGDKSWIKNRKHLRAVKSARGGVIKNWCTVVRFSCCLKFME